MNKKGNLSSNFNMSLGFLPILITILLCLVIPQDYAVYIGAGLGLIATTYNTLKKRERVPHFILYISTIVLLVFTVTSFIYCEYCPYGYLPITIEASIVVIMAILYLHKRRFINYYKRKQASCSRKLFAQGAESSVVAARILLLVAATHFLIVTLFKVTSYPISDLQHRVGYLVLPSVTFIITIFLNQVAIHYFNLLTQHIEYVPVVNTKGVVIGRSSAVEAINYKNEYINPVVRIAVSSKGKLYLCERSQDCIVDKGKTDVPMEYYLKYGETLEQAIKKLVSDTFPEVKEVKPLFNIMYHFENELTNRLIYLYIIDTDNEELVTNIEFKNGEMWSLEEIDKEIESDIFSECFKNEYDHLKEIICTRERYRVS